MKVYKNKNMPEWNPLTGTHYSQRITLTESEQKLYGLSYPIGTHYPHLDILGCFAGEPFRKHRMLCVNTCIRIISDQRDALK